MVADDEVRRFIEGFALSLTEAGMQRMAARMFGALLTAESGSLTAREIAERLGVSPAAVSGAVNYLTQTKMVTRVREPGERVDRYSVGDDNWFEALMSRTDSIDKMTEWLTKGAAALPDGSAARARMDETRDFFEYVRGEMPLMVQRWRDSRGT
jgi:DNA-binding transcriptional regulator GbsR (MarR family)